MARTTKRATLRDVKLNEISFVGKGDNKGAHILLLKGHPNPVVALGKEYKGDDTEEILQKWFDDDVSKADGIFKEEEAVMFSDLLSEKTIRDQVWGMVWMLEDSICSIMQDESGNDKAGMIQTTVDQFKTAITALTKTQKGGKENMNELQKAQEALAKAQAEVDTLTKQVETLTKEKEELVKQIPVASSVIKMEDLPEPVRKQMEDQQAQIKKQADDLEILKEAGVTTECITKAAEIGFISAEGVVVHEVLKDIKKASSATFEKVFTLLKAADARIKESGLFKENGKASSNSGATAHEMIVAKAKELKKTCPELSDAQAYDRIYKSDDDLRNQYISETRGSK